MAGNGSVTMLVFRSTVAGQTSIKATLLDAAGNFILPEPIVVATLEEIYTNPPRWPGTEAASSSSGHPAGRGRTRSTAAAIRRTGQRSTRIRSSS